MFSSDLFFQIIHLVRHILYFFVKPFVRHFLFIIIFFCFSKPIVEYVLSNPFCICQLCQSNTIYQTRFVFIQYFLHIIFSSNFLVILYLVLSKHIFLRCRCIFTNVLYFILYTISVFIDLFALKHYTAMPTISCQQRKNGLVQ